MGFLLSLICLLSLCFVGSAAGQDLPDDILADQYLLEATEALESGKPRTAKRIFEKIKELNTEPPVEFLFFYGKLLVEDGIKEDDMHDVRKGEAMLKQFILNIKKDGDLYRPTLKLLSAARNKIEVVERSRRRAAAEKIRKQRELKESLPSLLSNRIASIVIV